MKLRIMLLMLAGLLMSAATAGAREVRLQAGETYRDGNLTIICEAAAGQAMVPLSLRECQYWDDFNEKCFFEKTILTYEILECVEECQHWDDFNKRCDYQSKCTFYPAHGSFVRSTCDKFDDFNRKCLRTRETKIGPVGRRGPR